MSNHTPNAEQQKAIEEAKAGKNVLLEAGAGTGKTSTLVFMGAALAPKKCLYAAFTKSTQLDAEKAFKPYPNVEPRTMHSLAWRAIVKDRNYGKRFGPQKQRYEDIANHFDIQGHDFDREHHIRRNIMVGCIKRTVERFCKSADERVEWNHVDLPEIPTEFEGQKGQVRKYIQTKAQAWWEDSISKTGYVQFFQNESLKLFQLSHPVLPYEVIFYDEAQDANPVIEAIIMEQPAQKILVGDRNQQIYAWNGAVDAMDRFKADTRLPLTQSYRYGANVAAEGNVFLEALGSEINGQPFRVRGFDKIQDEVKRIEDLGTGRLSTPDAILCRSNAGCIQVAIDLYENGVKVAFAGGTEGNLVKDLKSFCFGATKLMKGEATDNLALCCYATWDEVIADVENGEADDIKMLVKLINTYGVRTLLDICNNSVNENEAQVVISTAHKAKGREWDRVQIGPDFKPPVPTEEGGTGEVTRADLMLLYVSVTRAKKILDKIGIAWFEDYRNSLEEAA